jgi:hypothetical protein
MKKRSFPGGTGNFPGTRRRKAPLQGLAPWVRFVGPVHGTGTPSGTQPAAAKTIHPVCRNSTQRVAEGFTFCNASPPVRIWRRSTTRLLTGAKNHCRKRNGNKQSQNLFPLQKGSKGQLLQAVFPLRILCSVGPTSHQAGSSPETCTEQPGTI